MTDAPQESSVVGEAEEVTHGEDDDDAKRSGGSQGGAVAALVHRRLRLVWGRGREKHVRDTL